MPLLIWRPYFAYSLLQVEYIELTSPVASEQSFKDCKTICELGLKASRVTYSRFTGVY